MVDGANQKKEFGLFEVDAVINKLEVSGAKFYCANKVIINGDQWDTVIEDGEKLRIKGILLKIYNSGSKHSTIEKIWDPNTALLKKN